MLKWDGHTHTKFCKHSAPVEQEEYIKAAVAQGFQRYSITEHPPLPDGWIDNPALMAELAMPLTELPEYFAYVQSMKQKYAGIIDIAAGLEVDYLYQAEEFSESMLAPWLARLEDVVVSVHYLPGAGGMRCIDFTAEDFSEGLLVFYGDMDTVVNEYFDHVEKAIAWAASVFSLPGRVRLGHINLIEKFHTVLPPITPGLIDARLRAIVPQLAATGIGLDVNTAGLRITTCGKSYVPEWLIAECMAQGIVCVFGSDSHKPEHVGFGREWFEAATEVQAGGI